MLSKANDGTHYGNASGFVQVCKHDTAYLARGSVRMLHDLSDSCCRQFRQILLEHHWMQNSLCKLWALALNGQALPIWQGVHLTCCSLDTM